MDGKLCAIVGYLRAGLLALAAFAAVGVSSAYATPPTMATYSDTVNVEGLIQEGGTLMATIVAAAVTVALAFAVVRMGLRWFRA